MQRKTNTSCGWAGPYTNFQFLDKPNTVSVRSFSHFELLSFLKLQFLPLRLIIYIPVLFNTFHFRLPWTGSPRFWWWVVPNLWILWHCSWSVFRFGKLFLLRTKNKNTGDGGEDVCCTLDSTHLTVSDNSQGIFSAQYVDDFLSRLKCFFIGGLVFPRTHLKTR